MTLRINFSHKYRKMPFGFQESKLLDVLPVRLEKGAKGPSERQNGRKAGVMAYNPRLSGTHNPIHRRRT